MCYVFKNILISTNVLIFCSLEITSLFRC